ncbi:MAG: hypothetical protein FWD82_09965 [Defluviitaleaceae bacterium]|nr:hypothetical protein [Defluviitaleaceae bacterium]
MKTNSPVFQLTLGAVLCAIGIMIPMFSPLRVVLPTMSYTLGSHVVIFIGMFFSVKMGVAVSLGTAFGFLLGPFPPIVAVRAASHVIFALVGGLWIKKHKNVLNKPLSIIIFSFVIAIIHAACEVLAVVPFYFTNPAAYDSGFLFSVLLLVGFGTIVHSMVDFHVALFIKKALFLRNRGKTRPA